MLYAIRAAGIPRPHVLGTLEDVVFKRVVDFRFVVGRHIMPLLEQAIKFEAVSTCDDISGVAGKKSMGMMEDLVYAMMVFTETSLLSRDRRSTYQGSGNVRSCSKSMCRNKQVSVASFVEILVSHKTFVSKLVQAALACSTTRTGDHGVSFHEKS